MISLRKVMSFPLPFGSLVAATLFLVITSFAPASAQLQPLQPRTILIMGSSTAAGSGASVPDSGWVPRYLRHLKSMDSNWRIVNFAVGGYTTYRILPHPSNPPEGRPIADTVRNVTRAVLYRPTGVIIAMPRNDVSLGYTLAEQEANWNLIESTLVAANIPFWVTSSMPYTKQPALIPAVIRFQEWIRARFPFSLDFWTDIANPDGTIQSTFDFDGLHVNDQGHRLLALQAIRAGIAECLVEKQGGATTPPATPQLRASTQIAKSDRITVALAWQPVPANCPASYQIQIATDSTFADTVFTTNTMDSIYPVNWLPRGKPYAWRVRAYNLIGTSGWSVSATFLNPPLPAPHTVAPADHATGVIRAPRLVWNLPRPEISENTLSVKNDDYDLVRDLRYRLQISTDVQFSQTVFDSSAISDTSTFIGPLNFATQYFWRVRTETARDTSVFTPTRRFTTDAQPTALRRGMFVGTGFALDSQRVRFALEQPRNVEFLLYDTQGKSWIAAPKRIYQPGMHTLELSFPKASGVYRLIMRTDQGHSSQLIVRH